MHEPSRRNFYNKTVTVLWGGAGRAEAERTRILLQNRETQQASELGPRLT